MKTITLKATSHFFDEITNLSKMEHISKSELIRRAVLSYKKALQHNRVKAQMEQASINLRKQGLQDFSEFDPTIHDGLDNV